MRWFFISFLVLYLGLHYYVFHRISNDLRLTYNVTSWLLLIMVLLAFFGVFNQIFLHHYSANSMRFGFIIELAYIWVGMLSIAFTFLLLGNILFIFLKNPSSKILYNFNSIGINIFNHRIFLYKRKNKFSRYQKYFNTSSQFSS